MVEDRETLLKKSIVTGVDLVDINRIEKSLLNKIFLEKHFTEKEIELFFKKNHMAKSVAANFAAKEAFSKAVGTGIRGFALKDVEVLRDSLGAPYYNFYNKAKDIVKNSGYKFSLSISHTDSLAIAFVVAYI